MAFRFQRRIKILPGLRLNVSKTGISWTAGTRGASITAKDGKLTGNVGLPGTGISYRKRLDQPETRDRSVENEATDQQSSEGQSNAGGSRFWIFVLLVIVLVIGILIGKSMR